jgi:hypothetical protein
LPAGPAGGRGDAAPTRGATRSSGIPGVARPIAAPTSSGVGASAGATAVGAGGRRVSKTGGRAAENASHAAPLLTAISGPEEDMRAYALAAEEFYELEDDIGYPGHTVRLLYQSPVVVLLFKLRCP